MFIPENHNIEKNPERIWLSSPTMHGPEFAYMKEAYDTKLDEYRWKKHKRG